MGQSKGGIDRMRIYFNIYLNIHGVFQTTPQCLFRGVAGLQAEQQRILRGVRQRDQPAVQLENGSGRNHQVPGQSLLHPGSIPTIDSQVRTVRFTLQFRKTEEKPKQRRAYPAALPVQTQEQLRK